MGPLLVSYGVRHPNVGKQFEVDELEHGGVEFKEGCHHFVVDVKGHSLVELVWGYPCDGLSHYFHAVVDSLDGQECLREGLRDGAVQHEVSVQAAACVDLALLDVECLVLG